METIDFSFWSLFARATFAVKATMVLMIAGSIWAWAIIVQKHILYRAARRAALAFDRSFWSGEPLDGLFADVVEDPRTAPERIFVAGMTEWHRSQRDDGAMIPGATARIDRSMDVAIARESERLNAGLSVLATVGSISPFVGLFGTVWGIMHAFEQIAISQNTSLAVVAPGIAEALLATGIGLLAAIPAVIFYNKLTSDSARIVGGYEVFADEFATLLSRESDA
jgi:biopolymer transport protein TolQ